MLLGKASEKARRSIARWLLAGVLLAAAGCLSPVRRAVDAQVCELSANAPDSVLPAAATVPAPQAELTQPPSDLRLPARAADASPAPTLKPVECVLDDEAEPQAEGGPEPPKAGKPSGLSIRLKVPPGLPGAEAKPLQLPRDMASENERHAAIEQAYPSLPPLGSDPAVLPGPGGNALTLGDLQRLASANSPLLRQAAADVTGCRGAAIQAGLPPNPTFGFEDDTAGTSGSAGYLGGFLEQKVMTAGKLKLAEAAAGMDYFNAQVALRRARIALAGQVRAGYFAVLVARENMRVSRVLSEFTDAVFRIQVNQLKVGVAANYEPMQLRVLAMQARANLVQARNRYVSAWKQLAAAMGLPGMPPTEVAGRPDMAIPAFRFDAAQARVLSENTDVLTAQNGIRKARYNLRLAQVTAIPDVDVKVLVQKDFTGPPFELSPSIMVSIPVPVWDHNQGGIMQAQGQLVRALEESHRVRNDLTARLADAFERYENNRILLKWYRERILPDQVRVYRGVFQRHDLEPALVGFGDVVTAQQTLAAAVTTYVATLGAQWSAVVDVATLLQADDLFGTGAERAPSECVMAVPDLSQVLPLPCGHACSEIKDPALKAGDGHWPAATPDEKPVEELMPAPKRPAEKVAPPAEKKAPPLEKKAPPAAPIEKKAEPMEQQKSSEKETKADNDRTPDANAKAAPDVLPETVTAHVIPPLPPDP